MPALCRDCSTLLADPAGACAACGSARIISHGEIGILSIAHLDCDAFYTSVEKRDDPALADRPVVVGGRHRGVVAAACYVARRYGIRSAMPMFKALKACPDAVVIAPDMAKYQAVSRQIRALLDEITPLVEPLSIDEAFLDLTGTERLHHRSPAEIMAALARRIEDDIGITVSVGLSYNKFLAKIASDLDKPRGFAVIGRAEAVNFLHERPVGLLWGVGKALQRRLADDGIVTIGQLQTMAEGDLVARYGEIGHRLAQFSHGDDDRRVDPESIVKSVSAETTFDADIGNAEALAGRLWPLCEKVSARLKRGGQTGRVVVLKLRGANFRLKTRRHTLATPTQLAETLYRSGRRLLDGEADGTRYRLIGIGVSDIAPAGEAPAADLFGAGGEDSRDVKIERAMDDVRARFGAGAIVKGRSLAAGGQ